MPDDALAALFDADFLARLARLRLAVRRRLLGAGGEAPIASAGGGRSEFREHRPYVAGDDPRTIDWNVAARLDQVFVKEFTASGDLTVRLRVDVSDSMDVGTPPKRRLALQVAAALAYLALHQKHAVRVELWTPKAQLVSPPISHVGGFAAVLDWLRRRPAETPGASRSPARGRARSLIFVLSDLLDDALVREVALLEGAGADLCLTHVLAPEDLDPPWRGRLRLTDAESGERFDCVVGPDERRRYGRALEAFLESRRTLAARHRAGYLVCSSAQPIEEVIFDLLRREGRLTERS